MLRLAFPLSVALAVLCGGELAHAARTTTPVGGAVRAVAFTGDAVAIARTPPRGTLTVERYVTGAAPATLLGTTLRDADDQVQLAGSAQALAIGLQPDSEESFGPSRVFAGPAAGPLRQVAACEAGLLAPPVAVLGARIAWRDGACGDPSQTPSAITPAAVVVGAADPGIAPARIALDPDVLPVSIALTATGGLVGALRPSFFAVDSEVRDFTLRTAGAALVTQRGGIAAPVGVLANGTRVFSLARLDAVDGGDDDDDDDEVCPNSLFTIAAGATERRELPAGGCLIGADVPAGSASARAGTDRVFALVSASARASDGPPQVSVVSMRADGGDRRVHASGSYRPPVGIAADGDRLAFWHARCTGAITDVVVVDGAGQDEGPAPIASCRTRVLTTAARVRDGRTSVRVRCPSGCRGIALDARREPARRLRAFAFGPGTHALSLTLSKADRKRGRLRLALAVENGPARLALIRLRR